MGVIKDGAISGNLPSNEAFVVHYPGYPSSTARAIETLGGTEGILKARCSQLNKLELRFRPEDPYSHPVFGRVHQCSNFLLKISKSKSNVSKDAETSALPPDSTTSGQKACLPVERDKLQGNKTQSEAVTTKEAEVQTLDEHKTTLCADIIARVPEGYNFDGMADYQHVLPVHADIARRKKRNWTEVEPHFEKVGLMDIDQEDVMILVPPLFSLKDMPENLVLRKPPTTISSKKKQEGPFELPFQLNIEPSLAIDFNVKDIPSKVNWEEHIRSDQREHFTLVSRMFEERPIWPKASLAERLLDKGLNLREHVLKRILCVLAYYFSNGPFIRFWIRKGYDARKDPESRIYQSVDFRTPPSLRSYCDINAAKGLKHRWDALCAFRVFPYKCQTTLQLCEIDDEYIKEEIRKPVTESNCSLVAGWFSPSLLESFRRRVSVRFLSVYPETGAEHLLKSASARFEKSKRMVIRKCTSKCDENENHRDSREVTFKEDKEPENVEECEVDAVEADNDDEDDDFDAYDTLELAGDDGEFPLRSDSYMDMENVSRTYLQQLFGSFPTNEAGTGAVLDANFSDEEYQILEQDSGSNYSDEDDS